MILFDGLPLHPLVVHAPLVLLPLVAAGLVLLLVRPALRRHLAPLLAILAIGAAATTLGAVWSGEDLGEALGRGDELDHHQAWGELTRSFALLVAGGATTFAVLDRVLPPRPRIAGALGIVTTGLAIAAVGVVAITGHAGATLAWEGQVTGAGDTDGDLLGAAPLGVAAGVATMATIAPSPAGAGSGDGGAEQLPALPGAGAPGVEVVLGEWALVPSAQEAPPGTVTFRFRNFGTVAHALRIRTSGSGRDRLEWRSEVVAPGGSGLLVAELAPGTYEVDCPVEDAHGEHDALGMEMLLPVREGAPELAPLPAGDGIQADVATAPVATARVATADAATADPAAPSAAVEMRAFGFQPAALRVPVGSQVVWTNRDPAVHTATGERFDTGRLAQGAAGTATFDTAGTFDYVCALHPSMRGRLIVEPTGPIDPIGP